MDENGCRRIGECAFASSALAAGQECRSVESTSARLACYDAASPPKIEKPKAVEKDALRPEYKDPLPRGGRPNHRQTEEYLSRLLNPSEKRDRSALALQAAKGRPQKDCQKDYNGQNV